MHFFHTFPKKKQHFRPLRCNTLQPKRIQLFQFHTIDSSFVNIFLKCTGAITARVHYLVNEMGRLHRIFVCHISLATCFSHNIDMTIFRGWSLHLEGGGRQRGRKGRTETWRLYFRGERNTFHWDIARGSPQGNKKCKHYPFS